MKKGYSNSFDLTSSVYGYEINTSFFKETWYGLKNVYITRICDTDKSKFDALVTRHSYSLDDAKEVHSKELQKCFDGAYDNYNIEYCPQCHREGHIHKDGNWLNSDDDNLVDCDVCHGDGYKVIIGGE